MFNHTTVKTPLVRSTSALAIIALLTIGMCVNSSWAGSEQPSGVKYTTISFGGVFPQESSAASPAPVDHDATDATTTSSACLPHAAYANTPHPIASSLPPQCLTPTESPATTPVLRLSQAPSPAPGPPVSDDCNAYSREASYTYQAYAKAMAAIGLTAAAVLTIDACEVYFCPPTAPEGLAACKATVAQTCTAAAANYAAYQYAIAQIKAKYTRRCIAMFKY